MVQLSAAGETVVVAAGTRTHVVQLPEGRAANPAPQRQGKRLPNDSCLLMLLSVFPNTENFISKYVM